MDMGMMEQILPPGVQDGEKSDLRTQMQRIGCDDAQRLGRGTEKNIVNDLFVVEGYGGNLFRYCEDDVKIGSIEQLGLPILYPLSTSE